MQQYRGIKSAQNPAFSVDTDTLIADVRRKRQRNDVVFSIVCLPVRQRKNGAAVVRELNQASATLFEVSITRSFEER